MPHFKILQEKVVDLVSSQVSLEKQEIFDLLEIPKNIENGHICFPTFKLAKNLKQAPPKIAQELTDKINQIKPGEIEKVSAASGYVNFQFSDQCVQEVLMAMLDGGFANLGHGDIGQGKTVAIDYASPNVAKPMHIGHFRAAIIGQAVRNLAATQGYKVLGINHLGDWGVQFGKLAWAYKKWGKEYSFAEKPFDTLLKLYVRFHEEAEKNAEIEALGSLEFKKLEEGDLEVRKIWQLFLEISLKDFQRLWDMIGLKHELTLGESFYSDKLADVEERLTKAHLLEESEGAVVVKLDELGLPPCLIRKSDGASLYATRDLATAIYRREVLKADLNLYVVGQEQTLHFTQIFAVLKKLGYDWVSGLHHISFGMYRFKDIGKMSTRKGNVIYFEDVINKAIELSLKVIEEKNPDLKNKNETAKIIGVGALIFNDLFNDRVKNVDFDWEKILDFEGNSGPFVQYAYVRCRSLLAKYGKNPQLTMASALSSNEERELVKLLVSFEVSVENAFKYFKPNILAQYLIDLVKTFNHFYQVHRILTGDPSLISSRMELVNATMLVLQKGLLMLNIKCPEAM